MSCNSLVKIAKLLQIAEKTLIIKAVFRKLATHIAVIFGRIFFQSGYIACKYLNITIKQSYVEMVQFISYGGKWVKKADNFMF